MQDLNTREKIRALYQAGEEAVITFVQGLLDHISLLEKRINVLEEQLKKNSRNSDKPPSSDGLKRHIPNSRTKSSRQSGAQKGHKGHTLKMVSNPDHIQVHSVEECSHCHASLKDVEVFDHKKRQVFDIYSTKSGLHLLA